MKKQKKNHEKEYPKERKDSIRQQKLTVKILKMKLVLE